MTQPLEETMRWYGPQDPVTLTDIRQCGASGVITSLHDIPYGAVWPVQAIRERQEMIARSGLEWIAVESLPVHEDIKNRTGRCREYIGNYRTTLRNLGRSGVGIVIYNFMPVLDWVRTDTAYTLQDGSECLYFDPVAFAAFDLHLLRRKGAEKDYTASQLAAAGRFMAGLTDDEKSALQKNIIDVLPGTKPGFGIEDIRRMVHAYRGVTRQTLKDHYRMFLEEIMPAAEEACVRMAVHPDDPPFSLLGLPRIVSCEEDIRDLLAMVNSPANGLCFCIGSLSARKDNDIVGMIREFGDRIHFVHVRSTQRNSDGSFYEANHLEGSVDMYHAVRALIEETRKRRQNGRKDWRLPMRPDHGHRMLSDLQKPPLDNPGYDCIGRMRGLAEIRGLQMGIARSIEHGTPL